MCVKMVKYRSNFYLKAQCKRYEEIGHKSYPQFEKPN